MPPIRRKKKGEDDSASDTTGTTKGPTKVTKTTTKGASIRTNPLGNKSSRPAKARVSPDDSDTSKTTSKPPIPRRNMTGAGSSKMSASTKPGVAAKPAAVSRLLSKPTASPLVSPMKQVSPIKRAVSPITVPPKKPSGVATKPGATTAVPPPATEDDVPLSPVSPVSPVANESNQIVRRPSTSLSQYEEEPTQADNEIAVLRTPTSTMKRQIKPAVRRITQRDKDRIIENIRYEVERRAKTLRQKYQLHAELVRQSVELRIDRIPYRMQKMTMGELYDKAAALENAGQKENQIEAAEARKFIEDVRRLSNPVESEPQQLTVSKMRIVSPAAKIVKPSKAPASPIKSPVIATAHIAQVSQIPQPSPTKPQTFTQKTMTTIKNKLAPKKAAANASAAVAAAAATSGRVKAASATVKNAAKTTKAAKGKTATAPPAPAKTGGRSLRSRK